MDPRPDAAPGQTPGQTLVAEDLLLLLLDDEKGTMAASTHEQALFGGAVLVELALAGLVEVEEKRGIWHTPKVTVAGSASTPTDPLLAEALATVAERPRSATGLVPRLGKGVRDELARRLESRGILEREERKVLGLFPSTRWPAADLAHERQVRERLHGVLVHGLTPDPRSGALVALLHAVDQAHKVIDSDSVSSRDIKRRAKEVSEGEWAAKAVKDAVTAAQAATFAAITAASSGAAASST